LNTPESRNALVGLVSLAIARGAAKNVLEAVDLLFLVSAEDSQQVVPYQIGPFLDQLCHFEKPSNLPFALTSKLVTSAPFNLDMTIQVPHVEAMVTDGKYLYFSLPAVGLLKVGTGFSDTIRGHVYASFGGIKGTISLALMSQKLYVFSDATCQGRDCLIQIFDCDLNHQTQICLVSSMQTVKRFFSDGKHLYLLGILKNTGKEEEQPKKAPVKPVKAVKKKKSSSSDSSSGSGSSTSSDDSSSEEQEGDSKDWTESNSDPFMLEVFDPAGQDQISPLKSIKLSQHETSAAVPGYQPNFSQYEPGPCFASYPPSPLTDQLLITPTLIGVDLAKGQFYSDGKYLVSLVPSPPRKYGPENFIEMSAFSLVDGKIQKEKYQKTTYPIGTLFTYCFERQEIWQYNHKLNAIYRWVGTEELDSTTLGSELHLKRFDTFIQPLLATPEQIQLPALDVITVLIANLDRLAKQHSTDHELKVADPGDSASNGFPTFDINESPKVFELLGTCIRKAQAVIKQEKASDKMTYVLVASVRLLKIFLQNFILKSTDFSGLFVKAGFHDGGVSLMLDIRSLLSEYIEGDLTAFPSEVAQALRSEAIDALITGLTLFYRTPSDQLRLVTGVLKSKSEILLPRLLSALSSWRHVGDILKLDEPLKDSKSLESSVKSIGASKRNKKERRNEINDCGMDFLSLLVDYLVEEVKNKPTTPSASCPKISSGVQLLLVLQREILSNSFGNKAIIIYVAMITQKCAGLLQSLSTEHAPLFVRPENQTTCPFDLYSDTILGVVVSTMVTLLCKKEILKKPDLSVPLLDSIIALAHAYDLVNVLLESVKDANTRYLNYKGNLTTMYRVETRHPYPAFKTTLKETITVPGAKALIITFDSRSKTHGSSDTLEIYPQGQKENPLTFSGINFPLVPLVLPGDNVSLNFSSSSKNEGSDAQMRWGFKCCVRAAHCSTEFEPNVINYWSLDVEAGLVWFASESSVYLALGEPLSDQERRCTSFIENGILAGGLAESTQDSESQWVAKFIEESSPFWEWLVKAHPGRPKVLAAATKQMTELAERTALGAAFRHLGLVGDAMKFSGLVASGSELPTDLVPKFKLLGYKSWQDVGTPLVARGRIERQWQGVVQGCVEAMQGASGESVESLIASFFEDLEGDVLKEVCYLKGLPAGLEKEAALPLVREKLQSDIEAAQAAPSGEMELPHNIVCRPFIDRVKFLMTVAPISTGSLSHLFEIPKEEKIEPTIYGTFQTWKKWCSLHTRNIANPFQAICSLGHALELSTKDLEKVFALHATRAKTRVQGFHYFNRLLKISSLGCILQQVLRLNFETEHYLFGIGVAGSVMSEQVTDSFGKCLTSLVETFSNAELDERTRCLALRCCGLFYQDYDASLLQNAGIFPALRNLISEAVLKETPTKENRSSFSVRGCAWTAFRLLATLSINWNQAHPSIKESVSQLQAQVFDILCFSLGQITKTLNDDTRSKASLPDLSNRCFELLSLLYSLQFNNALSPSSLQSLISILGTSVAPRAQRLVLRLCRKLLPAMQDSEFVNFTVGTLMTNLSRLVSYGRLMEIESPDELKISQDPQVAPPKEDDLYSPSPETDFVVKLMRWDAGEKRLSETLTSALGNAYAEGRSAGEAKAKALISTIASNGSAVLVQGDQKACKKLAQIIAIGGGSSTVESVIVAPVDSSKPTNPNEALANPFFWVDAPTGKALASETIQLIRILLGSGGPWLEVIRSHISKYLSSIPTCLAQKSQDQTPALIVASLSVLGSFEPVIRVGGKIRIKGSNQCGMVISTEDHESQVLLDSSTEGVKPTHVETFQNRKLRPLAEVTTDLLLLGHSFIKELLPLLLASLNDFSRLEESFHFFCLEIQSASIKVLSKIYGNKDLKPIVLSMLTPDWEQKLIMFAKKCIDYTQSSSQTLKLYNQATRLFWDISSSPLPLAGGQGQSPMVYLVPYFPNAKKANLLPTGLVHEQGGLVFWGEDNRTVECIALIPPSARGPRYSSFSAAQRKPTDVLIAANAPIPLHLEYYFEMTVLEAPSSPAPYLSIGLSPEGAIVWDFGSYRFQANKMKTHFPQVGRDPKTGNYGATFKSGDTVGCGWNPITKAIYFTKGKEVFPDAWNVSLTGSLIRPTVGISKGVKVKVNFGQEPFQFKFQINEELSAAALKEKQEEIERKLKAEQAEEAKKQAQEAKALQTKRERDAEEVMALGFTKQQVLRAMEITRYSGNKEHLCGWMIDHADLLNAPEPEKPKEKKEPKPVEKEEEPKVAVVESTPPEQKEPDVLHPENTYRTEDSKLYCLPASCLFKSQHAKYGFDNQNTLDFLLAPMINDMRSFMVRDHRQPIEIEDGIFQFKEHVANGNIAEANKLFEHLCGAPTHSISALLQKKTGGPAPPKIGEVEVGQYLRVQSDQDMKALWVPKITDVKGKIGLVKKIDVKKNLVLLSFYASELGILEDWWFPFKNLTTCTKQPITCLARWMKVKKDIFTMSTRLLHFQARSLLLKLAETQTFDLEEKSPLYLPQFLGMATGEYLSPTLIPNFFGSSCQNFNIPRGFEVFIKNVLDCYGKLSLDQKSKFINVLWNYCQGLFEKQPKSGEKLVQVDSKAKPLQQSQQEISIPGAHSLIINFDRTTALGNTQLGFYSDKECRNTIKIIDQQALSEPLFLPCDVFYHKPTTPAIETYKYKFVVVPYYRSILEARWIVEFLVSSCNEISLSIITQMINTILNFIYLTKIPTPLKQSFLVLLSQICFELTKKYSKQRIVETIPVERFGKLRQEMIALHEAEHNRGSLFSDYLQNLIELVVALKLAIPSAPSPPKEEAILKAAVSTVSAPATPATSSSASPAPTPKSTPQKSTADDGRQSPQKKVEASPANTPQKDASPALAQKEPSTPTPKVDVPKPKTPPARRESPSPSPTGMGGMMMMGLGGHHGGSSNRGGSWSDWGDSGSRSSSGWGDSPKSSGGSYLNSSWRSQSSFYDDFQDSDLEQALAASLLTEQPTPSEPTPEPVEQHAEEVKETKVEAAPAQPTVVTPPQEPELKLYEPSFMGGGDDSDVDEDEELRRAIEISKMMAEEAAKAEETPQPAPASEPTPVAPVETAPQPTPVVDAKPAKPEVAIQTAPVETSTTPAPAVDEKPVETPAVAITTPAPEVSVSPPPTDIKEPEKKPETPEKAPAPDSPEKKPETPETPTKSPVPEKQPETPSTKSPETPSKPESGSKTPSTTPAKKIIVSREDDKKSEPGWLSSVSKATLLCDFFQWNENNIGPSSYSSKNHSKAFRRIIKNAWHDLRADNVLDRIVCVQGIPTISESHRASFENFLFQVIDQAGSLLPGSLQTKIDSKGDSYLIVQTCSIDGVRNILSTLPKLSITLIGELAANSPTKDKPFTMTATKVKEGSTPFDEYVKSILIEQKPNTDGPPVSGFNAKCEAALTQGFIGLVGSQEGVLTRGEFEQLQAFVDIKEFTQLKSENLYQTYQTKSIEGNSKEAQAKKKSSSKTDSKAEKSSEPITGLTLEGFLKFTLDQCIGSTPHPMITLNILLALGFDLNFEVHHLPTSEMTAQLLLQEMGSKACRFNLEFDTQLVQYIESLYPSVPTLTSKLILASSLVPLPSETTLINYPKLRDIPFHILYLRFEILKQFNSLLVTVMPLVNLASGGVISTNLFNCKALIFHTIKMSFFYSVLDKTSIDGTQTPPPKVVINRLQLAAELEKKVSHPTKNTSFGIAFQQLKKTNPEVYRQKKPRGNSPHFSIEIGFEGEDVQGLGGPYRQFFTDVSQELQGPLLGILKQCPNGINGVGNNRNSFVFTCCPDTEQKRMLVFLGQLMGMAIRTGALLTLDLPPAVWKILNRTPLTLRDFEGIDQIFVQNLKSISEDPQKIIESQDTEFVVQLSDMSKKILKPNGNNIQLTKENSKEWCELAKEARLNESQEAINSVLKGLEDVIPSHLLRLCTSQDLEVKICGKPDIDVVLLKRHTEYNGVDQNASQVQFFWQVLESFTQQERRAFIQFAWAQERLPANDQEFIRTGTKMQIKPFLGAHEPDKVFPKADTCFFHLTLPEYSSPQILKERLLTAINFDSHSMNADANPEAQSSRRGFQ